DTVKGALYDPQGLDLVGVLESVKEGGSLVGYPDRPGLIRGWDSFQTISDTGADTIVEATFTNVEDGQPGLDHVRRALSLGKNVVTTNKGPIALAYQELKELAQSYGARLLFEGTVMSGTPVLRMASSALAGNRILGVRGILNGTSNYILTRMEDGLPFDAALAEAQKLGYAEANPTSDVDGFDAQYKLLILANTVLGETLSRDDIARTGIRDITPDDLARARADGARYKLIASLEWTASGLKGRVAREPVPLTDPLSGISGAVNALTFRCDLSGDVTMVGAGAGRVETGYALLIDCINLARRQI
ncbi:MAG: homoserine dehydrogenase, partial [Thermaerobacter sp.]|nr:homoserine dehydrogenase [Thermaerobacter sp.]